jgi:hypothetical protein
MMMGFGSAIQGNLEADQQPGVGGKGPGMPSYGYIPDHVPSRDESDPQSPPSNPPLLQLSSHGLGPLDRQPNAEDFVRRYRSYQCSVKSITSFPYTQVPFDPELT